MNRLFTKKPADDTKLTFAPMGQKPKAKTSAPDTKKKPHKKVLKKSGKVNPFAQKAAAALAGGATGAAK